MWRPLDRRCPRPAPKQRSIRGPVVSFKKGREADRAPKTTCKTNHLDMAAYVTHPHAEPRHLLRLLAHWQLR